MSLINDVLRDLERRQRGPTDALAGLRPAPRRGAEVRWWLWSFLLITLIAGGALAYGWSQTGGAGPPDAGAARTSVAKAEPAPAQPRAAPSPPAPVAPPARLRAVEAARDGDWLSLSLHAERPVAHELRREEQSLRLYLPELVLDAGLPDIAVLDARLKTVDLRQREGGAELAMSFSEPVRVQIAWRRGAEQAVLVLDIHLPTATVAAEPAPGEDPAEDGEPPTATATPPVPAVAQTAPEPAPAAVAARFSKQAAAPTPEQQARQLLREAERLQTARRPRAAIAAYRESLELQPGSASARAGLVQALLGQGRRDEAMAQLRAGLEQPGLAAERTAGFAARLARLLSGRGETEAAVAVLETHAPDRLADGEYHALLAALYQRVGNYPEAVRWYQRILELDPQRAVWWMGLGLALEGATRFEAARQAYTAALNAGGLGPDPEHFVRERLRALQ